MNSLHSGLLCSNQSFKAPPTKPHPIIPTLIIILFHYIKLLTKANDDFLLFLPTMMLLWFSDYSIIQLNNLLKGCSISHHALCFVDKIQKRHISEMTAITKRSNKKKVLRPSYPNKLFNTHFLGMMSACNNSIVFLDLTRKFC